MRKETDVTVQPIRKQLIVEAPQERAFRVFTENMGRWWPAEHHIGKAAFKDAVMEKKEGGRWYEVGDDGTTCEWGKVLTWDPPRKLVLAWQITAQWQYDAQFVTEVEVTFTPEGPQRTRVELEHRNLERFGEAAEQTRGQMDPGWAFSLEAFAQAARG